jgi:hypothetical protein
VVDFIGFSMCKWSELRLELWRLAGVFFIELKIKVPFIWGARIELSNTFHKSITHFK